MSFGQHGSRIIRPVGAYSSAGLATARISRRRALQLGAGAAGALSMPYVFSRRASAQGDTLKFWQFYGPGGTVEAQSQWFEDTVKAWNDQNEKQIELVYVPTSDYINGTKLQTSFASGEGPDIFLISPGDFLRYANGNVLADLTPYMDQAAIDDFYPDVIASRQVDGKTYCLPMEVEPMAFYYDTAAWSDAGLTDADIPQSWEQLLSVAEQLTTDERFGISFETGPGYYQNFTWYPFMWMGGAEIVNADGKTSGLRDAGAVQALKLWQDAINNGVAPREFLGTGGGDASANLGAGYVAIQNVGIWAIAELQANSPDTEFDVFKLPLPDGGTYSTVLGGWGFVANSQGADVDTAAQFCVWALGSMEQDSIQRMVDWCIKVKSDIAPRKSARDAATEQGGYAEGPLKKFNEEIFPGGRGEPRVTPEIYKAVSDAIQSAQLDGADPQAAGETAAQAIESFLTTYQGAPIL